MYQILDSREKDTSSVLMELILGFKRKWRIYGEDKLKATLDAY